MSKNVEFNDYTVKVLAKLDQKAEAFLEEAKGSISSQASRNSPIGNYPEGGALKQSFQTDSFVDTDEKTAYIGSSLFYAPYQEQGTGEYALNGDGRKGGWCYIDPHTGEKVFTRGNRPRRMLYHAYEQKKTAVINRAKQIFGEI